VHEHFDWILPDQAYALFMQLMLPESPSPEEYDSVDMVAKEVKYGVPRNLLSCADIEVHCIANRDNAEGAKNCILAMVKEKLGVDKGEVVPRMRAMQTLALGRRLEGGV
jgi:hypothetical protein